MDRLHAMQVFVRVAELGSFAAAAVQMNLARSQVTRLIAALESHLGAKLLARSTRRLSLTAAGAAYLEKCRAILALVDTAETDIAHERRELRGTLRVALPQVFGVKRLAPLLLEFAHTHPQVSLDMDFRDSRVNLIDEGLDLSIRITRQLSPRDVARRIGTVAMRVVAAPDYLARHGTPAHPDELRAHHCLGYTAAGTQHWPFVLEGRVRPIPITSRLNANNGEVLSEAAARGLGITYQPDFIVDDFIAAGRVVPILNDFATADLGIHALLPGSRHLPNRVRALIDFLANRLEHDPAP